jgi:tRNA threonylcarbamoyladenosine biosynthesis protein TsaE
MDRSIALAAVPGSRVSTGPDDTHEIGRRLGAAAVAGTAFALVGPLGAGKTQLTKGIAAGLEVASVVNSPTYVLMNEHVGRLRLHHIDAYRLGDPGEAFAAGLLDERQAGAVTVIEWADRLDGWLPADRLEIRLETPADAPRERIVSWTAYGNQHAALAAEALDRT